MQTEHQTFLCMIFEQKRYTKILSGGELVVLAGGCQGYPYIELSWQCSKLGRLDGRLL